MAKKLTGLLPAMSRTHAAKAATRPDRWIAPNAMGDEPAEMVVLVGDQFGRVIGELDGEVVGVAWKLNDYGQARLVLPRSASSATERLLRPGNRMLIQMSNGLPDWGGLIDPPRRWRNGRIEVTGYSGERLLADRVTDRGRYFANATAGDIFRALLNEAVPVGVEIGQVWMGGSLHGPDYHYRGLHDIFTKSLTGMEQADWNVDARLVGGRIVFRANFYERRGRDHGRRLALIEGVNLAPADLNEQGTLVNEWFLAGAGSGWGADSRIYATARDENSIRRIGLRQRGDIRADVSVQETLDNHARAALAESMAPRPVVDPLALDRPPARWGQYEVGDTIRLELYEVGFGGYETSARIRAREYLPGRGVCSLVVE